MLSEYYLLIKSIHIHAAAFSILLFVGRGFISVWYPGLLKQRWLKLLPHIIDTVLLLSALTLAYLSAQYPGKDAWLTAKVTALVLYIVFGTLALKRGRNRRIRTVTFVAAVITFGYIVSVAVTRSPTLGF